MARTTIPAELVAINAIQGTLIADNAITAVHIATNAVSGTLVADNAITSTHIAQNNVTATQIAQNTITVTQMADSAIETAKINNDAVTQAKIADDAVGPDQLAANAVVSASIANGTIVEADMADNAVTLAKMASLARGSIIYGDSAGDPAALSIGSNGTVLSSDGTDVSWAAASGGVAGISSSADATAITIDSSENVGIGETAPDKRLHIKSGSVNNSMIKIESTATNSYPGLQIVNDAQAWEVSTHGGHSDALTFYNGTTHTFALATNGNVGIGTTSPSSEFHVKGDAATVARVEPNNNSGKSTLLLSSAGAGDGGMQYDSNSNLMHLFSYNYMTFNVGTGNLSGGYPSNERMRITNTGSVGINETSPDFSGFGSNGGGLELDDVGSSFTAVKVSQGSTGNLYLAASTGAGYLWQHSNSPLIIGTNNAERIRIQDGTGRMGINSVGIAYSSSEKLSLYNDNFGFGIKAAYTGMGIWNTESSGGYIAFAYGSGGAAGGSISYSGGTTSYNTSSDYRLKENVDYTWDATTRLKQLKPARFNWISDDTDTLIDGFLAHEVSSIVPEAVTGEKDAVYTAEEAENSAGAEAGDIKVQVMDNAKLVPLLVKTIQELEARVKILEG